MGLEHSPCKWPGWVINGWSELTSYPRDCARTELCDERYGLSGRADSNRRPLDPQSSALTKLRHGPSASTREFTPRSPPSLG